MDGWRDTAERLLSWAQFFCPNSICQYLSIIMIRYVIFVDICIPTKYFLASQTSQLLVRRSSAGCHPLSWKRTRREMSANMLLDEQFAIFSRYVFCGTIYSAIVLCVFSNHRVKLGFFMGFLQHSEFWRGWEKVSNNVGFLLQYPFDFCNAAENRDL